MRLRALRYFVWRLGGLLRPSTLLAVLAEPFGVRLLWPGEVRRGIRIVDPFPQTFEAFVRVVDAALALVEEKDAIRFARIKREIYTIINMPTLGAGAAYVRRHRTCHLDLRCFPITQEKDSAVCLMACLLVHEATHGQLYTRRVLQSHRNLSKVERLCWNEEYRFAQKIGFDLPKWDPAPHDGNIARAGDLRKFASGEARRMWKSLRP